MSYSRNYSLSTVTLTHEWHISRSRLQVILKQKKILVIYEDLTPVANRQDTLPGPIVTTLALNISLQSVRCSFQGILVYHSPEVLDFSLERSAWEGDEVISKVYTERLWAAAWASGTGESHTLMQSELLSQSWYCPIFLYPCPVLIAFHTKSLSWS